MSSGRSGPSGGPLAPLGEPLEPLLSRLGTDPETGLSQEEAAARLLRHGKNRLPEPPRPSQLLRFLSQFTSPLVLTLVLAASVALAVAVTSGEPGGFLSRYGDALAILLIIVLNAILGYAQEHRAEAALQALQRMAVPTARVMRGEAVEVPAELLVPGDVLVLEAGDAVAADARLIHSASLATEESALTGESVPVPKDARAQVPEGATLAEQQDRIFLGTSVVRGSGRAVVVATGAATELGRIGEYLSAPRQRDPTPLERNLQGFGKRVLWACLAVSAVLFAWGLWQGTRSWPALLLEAVSFAVAAIPEGLPAITTITLALGMQRMARRGVLVRKLPAVETLGGASVICTDKTGTLTQNQMTVRVVHAGGARYRVSGEGYAPSGALLVDSGSGSETGEGRALSHKEVTGPLRRLLHSAVLCNHARLAHDAQVGWRVMGDPTEGALLTLAGKGGVSHEALLGEVRVVDERPFDSDRKRMTVVVRLTDGSLSAHCKGSADVVLPLCSHIAGLDGDRPLTEEERGQVLAEAERLSRDALRVLALADRRMEREGGEPEEGLTLLGLVGMMDPPREGVREAIATCREAGVEVIMITGDHALTAAAIARELNLWRPGDESVTGPELERMDDAQLMERVGRVRVFARTTAGQKLRIVRALRRKGHVVAMTGDGVNDAPALREAHIGVAMGRGGTEVARQASDVVITDDNFATIVHGISEGRSVYRNIQKFVFYLLSSNVALAVAVFAAALSGAWLPLSPLMILGINFVTNGLPALALGVDAPDSDHMRAPPREARGGLLGPLDYLGIAYVGGVMGLLAILLYAWPIESLGGGSGPPRDLAWGRSMAYALLGISPLFHVWNCRSRRGSILWQRPIVPGILLLSCLLSGGIHSLGLVVPALRPVFDTHALSASDWGLVLGLSALIIPAVELAKLVARRTGK